LQRLSRSLSRKVKGSENRKKAKLKLASRAVADMGFFEFRRQLDSKTCSDCGNKLETLSMSVREWVCPSCGVIHNREVNAVINLKNMAVSSTVSSCAEEGSGLGRKLKTKPASVKQESSAKLPMSNLSSG
jgi:putative transposase